MPVAWGSRSQASGPGLRVKQSPEVCKSFTMSARQASKQALADHAEAE
jgi:hypothetical protein